ncbi:ankyrin repeat-containing protein ITN1-like [Lotus japonicus]|uniref:ankyrin repeat-containing protein ITN1-like n=1 Tax=Lotus japonicus TaxID=34305 RepID=UPI00259025F1|nr:ankyrin repeat-containing protein ITN1-like [Lotus japonicus]
MVRIPLTDNEDTTLHVAVSRGNNDFVREFVNYEHVTRQDLEIPNANGNIAFCLAAITGKREFLEIMIQKNEDLPLIHGQNGMLPVHLALLSGFHEIVQHLSSYNLLEKMNFKDIERLFFMALNSNIYGNFYVVESLFLISDDLARELVMIKDPENGQSLLHIVVLFRQNSIIDFILGRVPNVKLIIQAVDKDRNNVLHFAARQPEQASLSLRPDIRMQKELEWYTKMKKRVPPELWTMRNKDGMTPNDMFYANHRKLSNEVKDTAKAVAYSCMVVAALVVTVAFAAALTTPGDKNNAWFAVFIMTNTIAFFTSSLSIVAFLSIFTSSRFEESDFVISLYPNLIIGKKLLYISVVSMIIAFAAASFLIFGHIYKWVAYVVTSFGLLTIIFVLELQLSLFSRYIKPCLEYIMNQLARRIIYLHTVRMREKFLKYIKTDLPVSGSSFSLSL